MDNITKHQEACNKCEGDGRQFKPTANEFFAEWRRMLGLTQSQVVSHTGLVDISQLSKFERGNEKFSEGRMRDLAVFYTERGLADKEKK